MPELRVPVLRFASEAACQRAAAVLSEQQFDWRKESETEIGCTPWDDLDEAIQVLKAEGIACERADKAVVRLGPRIPRPRA